MTPTAIGYLLLPVNALLFTGLFAVNKEYSKRMAGATYLNALLFSVFAGLGNAVVFLVASLIQGFAIDPLTIVYGAAVGALFVLLQVTGVLAAKLGNMSFYSQSFMLGSMLLPFFYGVFFAGEDAPWTKILAIILMVVSLILPLGDIKKESGEGEKKKHRALFYVLCLLALLGNGAICVINSIHSRNVPAATPFSYTFVYSSFTAVFALVGFFFARLFTKDPEVKASPRLSLSFLPILLAVLYGACNAWGSYVGIEGILRVDASLFFPLSSGLCIVLTYIVCRVVYKEKSGLFATLGFVLTIIASGLFLIP